LYFQRFSFNPIRRPKAIILLVFKIRQRGGPLTSHSLGLAFFSNLFSMFNVMWLAEENGSCSGHFASPGCPTYLRQIKS